MAIGAPDPHNLRMSAHKSGMVDSDRECPGCGYNLRGLRAGSICPECGMDLAATIGLHRVNIDDPLSLAPMRVIFTLIRGCWAATVIVALAVALTLAHRFPQWEPSWSRWSLVPLSLLWVGAVIWLTPALSIVQGAARGFSRRSMLRRLTRWLQCGWVIAAVCGLLRGEVRMGVLQANLCEIAASAGFVIGLIGLVLLSIMLERLADWARDDTAQTLFNWAMWTLPITAVLMNVRLPIAMVNVLLGLLCLIGIGLFPFALMSLSGSVTLSVVHNYEHRQRAERQAQRQRRYDEHVERTVRTMDAERSRRGHV